MTELAVEQASPRGKFLMFIFGTRETRQDGAFYGYSLVTALICLGWLYRDRELVNPETGIGYWLGIVGASMMLLLLLYPVRKRIRVFSSLGRTSHWFRLHMILGVLGPLLVLYHSNFHLGSFNSKVALYCMLLVAGSGVVGRHLYARIHRGLYGRKTSLAELRTDLRKSLNQSHGIATIMPGLTAQLEAFAAEVEGDTITGSMGTLASFRWSVHRYVVWASLLLTARRELKAAAEQSAAVANNLHRLRRSSHAYIHSFVSLTGRVALFTLYDRLFSLWHILHLPLFFMLVVSAVIHVLAVHMY